MVNPEMIKCLDHGFVRLVNSMGTDIDISRAARVSYAAPAREEDSKLIKYLWDHKHTTPFEAVVFTFEVKAPIFVFRQWHRHRTWSYNELSARYRELPEEFYIPELKDIKKQSATNKQGRSEEGFAQTQQIAIQNQMYEHCTAAFLLYHQFIEMGMAKELARTVLPLNTYSHMFGTVNLLNLLKFINLRDHEHAQYEIRVYAAAMKELVRPLIPAVLAAFDEGDKHGNR